MTAMILVCGACAAQNFVSVERLAARRVPPVCWTCGAALELPRETDPAAGESNEDGKKPGTTGGREE